MKKFTDKERNIKEVEKALNELVKQGKAGREKVNGKYVYFYIKGAGKETK